MLVYGALDQAHDTPGRVGLCANAVQAERLRPQAHAFAFALMAPHGAGVKHALRGDGLNGRFARVPLDDQGNLARQGGSLGADFLHDFEGAQARVGAKQKRQRGQLGSHWQDPLQVELGLECRVLHTRAQSQLQAVAQGAQVGRTRCEAVHALVSASDGFFLGARVVHHKGVPVHGHVAARQGTKIHRARGVLGRQQGQVELCSELKPRGRMGVHALTQGRARGDCANVQAAGKEGIAPELLNGIEVVLALHQQAQVGLQNVAVGDATDRYGKFAVNQSVDAKALGILPNQRQTGVGGEVVGEFFDNKVGHVVLTFWANTILHLSG